MTARLGTLSLPHLPLPLARGGADVVAGITSGCVIVPCAIAYASLAGLPVQVGLYASLAGLLVYAAIGTSPILSVSVTAMIAILTAEALRATVPAGDSAAYLQGAATLALLAGVILIAVGFLRLGFMADFISLPALTGFKVGLAAWIISSQLGKLLGIPFTNETFFANVRQAVDGIGTASSDTAIFSAALLGCALVLHSFHKPPPAALVLVVLGIGAQLLFDVEANGVVLIGSVPAGLPPLEAPSTNYIQPLLPAAVGIAIMASFESIAIGRALAPLGTRPRVNRDSLALGSANLVSSMFQGMPAAGGGTQTTVNAESGARSQWSQIVAAGVVFLSLTVLAPLFGDLPQAALAVVICVAAAGMVSTRDLEMIRRIRTRDFVLATVAAASVIFLGPLLGLLTTVGASMLVLLYQANRPPIYELKNWARPRLLSVRLEGALYFANAERVRDRMTEIIEEHKGLRVLLLESSAIRDLEYTGMEALIDMARDMRANGTNLWLAGLNEEPKDMLRRRIHMHRVPGVYFFPDIRTALRFYDESQVREEVDFEEIPRFIRDESSALKAA